MKAKVLSSLASILSMAPLLYADYPAVVAEDSPLVYYRFEEAAGSTTIADSSGNGLDIDYSLPTGTTSLGEAGAIGLAALFNADEGIVTPFFLDPSIGDFTLEAIINPDRQDGAIGVFLANQDGVGIGRSNLLINATGDINAYIGAGTTLSGSVAENGTWYHVILTFDQSAVAGGTDPTLRFYIDGVEGNAGTRVPEAADGAWVLGSNKDLVSQLFGGLLDEVAIYDKRLDDPDGDGDPSDSRVMAHYTEYVIDSDVLLSFETDSDYVDSGQSATLSWRGSPVLTELSIDDGSGPVDVLGDTVDGVGSRVVSPTTTTTYTLSGTSPVGTEELEVTIVVDEPAVIDSFTASAGNVSAGATVDLSWVTTNATTVEIDNGVGMVDPISGSVPVVVGSDTTYTLTASNSQGSVTEQVSVTVIAGADPNLIAHWRVGEAPGETAGTSLISETGDLLIGTFVGAPVFDTTDPAPVPDGSSASIVFDGAGSWVDVLGYNGIGGTDPRTVAFWFKGPATQTVNNGTLVSWGQNTLGTRFDIRVKNNSAGILRAEVNGSGSDGTAIMADDTWHHCAVVFDPEIGTNIADIVYYIDGVRDTHSAPGVTEVNTGTGVNLRIGNSRTFARALTGKMDDIRIYDRALDENEVRGLFESMVELKITSVTVGEDRSVTISWDGVPGDYSVEYSFDLSSWLELDDPSIPVGETSATIIDNFIAPQPENTRVYYRVSLVE
ncbi:MAG: LamG domain-containing protein [Verrucomicrobiales bacterium]